MKEFDAALSRAYLYWGPNLLLVYHDNLLIITKTKDWEHSLCSLVPQPFKGGLSSVTSRQISRPF